MKNPSRFAAIIVFALVIAGCGRSDGSKPATQVAVKVNGEEISVHQLNGLLSRVGPVGNMPAERVRTQALERLVDQQLTIQKAKELKLDRDANIMASIENARRQILSQAYLEKVAASAETPTPEEIRDYYTKHPELFAKRRIYRFQELAAGVNDEQRGLLEARLKTAKNFNELATWMREQQIPFNADFSLKAAEQLPMGVLPKFQSMKPGEIATFPAPGRVLVVQLVAVQDAPMSEKDAEPFIGRFLGNQKRSEVTSREMKQLRTVAKLEYVGDFAKHKDKVGAEPSVAPDAKAAAKAAPKDEAGDIGKALTGLK